MSQTIIKIMKFDVIFGFDLKRLVKSLIVAGIIGFTQTSHILLTNTYLVIPIV